MTITISGHYDVNEAPEEGWLTDPWELAALDGFLYGRGVSDCKGPIIATLSAVRELVSKGELKVNVIFVFDGMNENGCLVSGCSLEEAYEFFLCGRMR
jgi:acetylornithine deacetylase/succinyl-diaminopimelate desuccinylase-like protein